MAARKNTRGKNLELRSQFMHLHRRDYCQTQIAAMLGITQQMVSYYIIAINKEWLVAVQQDIVILRAQELAKINVIAQSAWESWDRSKEISGSRNKEKELVNQGQNQKLQHDHDKREVPNDQNQSGGQGAGDAKFLSSLLRCSTERRKLLGLDAVPAPPTSPEQDMGPDTYDDETIAAQIEEFLNKHTAKPKASSKDTDEGEF